MKNNLSLLVIAFLAALGWRAVYVFGAAGVVGSAGIALVAMVYAWQRTLFQAYAERVAGNASVVTTS